MATFIQNSVLNIVSDAIFNAKCEVASTGNNVTYKLVCLEIELSVNQMTFENSTTKGMFYSFCTNELKKQMPELLPAKQYMDVDGNYTSNHKLWA